MHVCGCGEVWLVGEVTKRPYCINRVCPDTASNEVLHNEVRVFTSGTQLQQLPQWRQRTAQWKVQQLPRHLKQTKFNKHSRIQQWMEVQWIWCKKGIQHCQIYNCIIISFLKVKDWDLVLHYLRPKDVECIIKVRGKKKKKETKKERRNEERKEKCKQKEGRNKK